MPDTFCGRGGIALYTHDVLTAVCAMPQCEGVVVVPRLSTGNHTDLPPKLSYRMAAVSGKLAFVKEALRAAREQPFDVLLCGHINFVPIAWLLRRWTAGPLVLLIYGIDAWTPSRSALSNFLTRRVKHVVSISEITRRRFLEWSGAAPEGVAVVPNAIHPGRYGPGPKSDLLLDRYGLRDRRVLMTIGRMEAHEGYKGFDEILEVLPGLAKEVPDISYLVIGEGSDRARLEQKAAALGLSDRVVFAGFVPEAEKADHLRLADVFAMPSRGEGFGFVFLEAMACGVPVIASRTDGGREALRDGLLGRMVDPASPKEIGDAILSALGDSRGAVPEGLSYFAYPEFERRVQEYLGRICGESRATPSAVRARAHPGGTR